MADLSGIFDWFEKRMQARKRQARIQKASVFPVVEARIVHAAPALTKELLFEIQLSYRFEVAGEAAYGSAFSEPMASENYAKMQAAKISPETTLKVRYNASDPFENYALAADNLGALPFPLAE